MASSIVRCAVYTRKSSEEGLEQSFNSLHAQREACEAYIASQKHEGWLLIPTIYDDGGFSGGSMERPALKALLGDVELGLVDTIVVYKVDRLTRSLADFAKMVDRFDARGVSFVSITQAFNTTTSMGRLTLNVLLSFAQFEREVTGERIRDKIAASKAKGMWMGGMVPLGYDVVDRKLVINEAEAEHVRILFALYRKTKAADAVVAKAAKLDILSKVRTSRSGKASGGCRLGRGALYSMLANPLYVGDVGHKDKRFPGQHEPIVDRKFFNAVQTILEENRRRRRGLSTSSRTALLSGLVFDRASNKLTATHTRKANKVYHYYAAGSLRVPAEPLHKIVLERIISDFSDPVRLAALLPDVSLIDAGVVQKAAEVAGRLGSASPGDLRKDVLELVERVVIATDQVTVHIRLTAVGIANFLGVVGIPAALGKPRCKLELVVPGQASAPDTSLVSIVAQAREWVEMLTSGTATSLAAIASREHVTEAYVRRRIGAAFLAPDLVTAIVEGRQPRSLTADKLEELLPLPAAWPQQRALFQQLN